MTEGFCSIRLDILDGGQQPYNSVTSSDEPHMESGLAFAVFMERFSWEGDLTTPLAAALTSVEALQPSGPDSFYAAEHHASGNMMLP